MKFFWTGIIKPVIESLKPKKMVEIGVEKGQNTKNILEYCYKNDCELISIDPFPDTSLSELEYEYEDIFTLIKDLSLNVLSDINDAQIFFIDGDHNWYTVYNELMTIQDKAGKNFPLIFLHDVEWPYDRRDIYYNPDDIPPEYTNQYAKKGIDLYSKQLTDGYGFNNSFYNAVEQGNIKNGVLTAIEDFLKIADFDLKLIKIPGFHGLGIIYDHNTYMENNNFKREIDNLKSSLEYIYEYIHRLSYEQYDILNKNALLEGDILSKEEFNKKILDKIKNLNNTQEFLKQKINNLDEELSKKNREILLKNEEMENMILEKDKEMENLLFEKNKEIDYVNAKIIKEQNERINLERNIKTLSRSRKRELNKNFQILFSKYLSSEPIPKKSRLSQLSNLPYLFIILKSKGNLKQAWINIKGYRAIKSLKSYEFDEEYYLKQNENVLISGMNPLIHYMYYGYRENKSPSETFDVEYYLNLYGDVKTSGMNPLVHYSLYGIKEDKKINKDFVSVIVTSYNHEKYIRECIDSILMQKGVQFELIIGDDASTDGTRKILEEYQRQYPKIIKLLPETENMGVTKNLKRCFEAVTGDYVALCEGDDYWTDPYKLKKQVKFLKKRTDCAMCFNSLLALFEHDQKKNFISPKLTNDTFTTRDLILSNFIANFSCCMYRKEVIDKLPEGLYDIFTIDWMFNIAVSEFGDIGFLKDTMSVYRKHDKGLWSSRSSNEQVLDTLRDIDVYNEFLSFKYDSEFQEVKKIFSKQLS